MRNNNIVPECPLNFTRMVFDEENCWWICPFCGFVAVGDETCKSEQKLE